MNGRSAAITRHTSVVMCRQALGEYLKSKGADDSLLNGERLTCYEGLTAQAVDSI